MKGLKIHLLMEERLCKMKDINLLIESFNNEIKNIITKSKLPIGMIYYILKQNYNNIQKQYYGYLNTLLLKEPEQTEELIKEEIKSQGQEN